MKKASQVKLIFGWKASCHPLQCTGSSGLHVNSLNGKIIGWVGRRWKWVLLVCTGIRLLVLVKGAGKDEVRRVLPVGTGKEYWYWH